MWQVSGACVASDLWPVWHVGGFGKHMELLRMRSPVAVVFWGNNLGTVVFKTLVSKTICENLFG